MEYRSIFTRSYFFFSLATVAVVGGCYDGTIEDVAEEPATVERSTKKLIREVRDLAAQNNIGPLKGVDPIRPALVDLGRALLFDPILSGNRDISCMTCHHPSAGTSDGLTLAIGQGGTGLGPTRTHPNDEFIARNSPPLFNLHAVDQLFWDGRVSVTSQGGTGKNKIVKTPVPLPETFQATFEFEAMSVLGLFPVLSREEMRGAAGTNELADVPDDQPELVWSLLMKRLGAIPQYVSMFEAAYPGTSFQNMTFAHATNAMGAFMRARLTFNNTPWDRFLRGDDKAMTALQLQGAKRFLTARCKNCHSGDNLSDVDFHNVALAQFGPGAGNGPDGNDDFGRFNVVPETKHRYAFRTSPLRNVELTEPYGHAGQFETLFDFVDHYSDSADKLHNYDVSQIHPALRGTLLNNASEILATRSPVLDGVSFSTTVAAELTEFMLALTDEGARNINHLVPASVPSGLPVQ